MNFVSSTGSGECQNYVSIFKRDVEPECRRKHFDQTPSISEMTYQETIAALRNIGVGACETRIKELTERLKDGIPDERLVSPSPFHSGLVTINVSQPTGVADEVFSRNIVVRALPQLDAGRVSIPAVSTEQEIDAFVEANRTNLRDPTNDPSSSNTHETA